MPVLFSLLSLRSSFRVRAALQAEILALRHQFLVLQRANRNHRLELSAGDRRLWVWLSRFWLGWRSALLDRETGNRHRLAPQGLSPLLDLEEPGSERPTIYTPRDSRSDPQDESCQSTLGSTSHTRRIA